MPGLTDAGSVRSAVRPPGADMELVFGYVLVAFLLPSHHSGGCNGVDWGCGPGMRVGVLLIGAAFGIPIAGAALLVSCLVTTALAFRVRSGKAAGTAGTLIAWLLVGVLFLWYQTLGQQECLRYRRRTSG